MTKGLINCLKCIMALVSIFALIDMIILDSYKYICFPLSMLCIGFWELMTALNKDSTVDYHGYDNTGYSYSSNTYHQPSNFTYHTSYYQQSNLFDSKDVEEKAAKAVKRGLKITIEN